MIAVGKVELKLVVGDDAGTFPVSERASGRVGGGEESKRTS